MHINEQNLYRLKPEEVANDYLVNSFFSNFYDEIVIHECANKKLDDTSVNYPRNCWY